MKRLVFVVVGVLLAMVVLFTGCSSKAPPASAPVAPAAPPTQEVTGILKDVNTPAETGKDVVTIQTPQGEKTLPIAADTTFKLEGKACTLDQIAALDLEKVSYNCTTVYGIDQNGYEVVVGIDVAKTYP